MSESKCDRAIGLIAAILALAGATGCNNYTSIDNKAVAEDFNPRQLPTLRKNILAIYFSRYLAGANNDEQSVRRQVRYYRKQGINTLIVGVWGNGCTMYHSEVTQRLLGRSSCV